VNVAPEPKSLPTHAVKSQNVTCQHYESVNVVEGNTASLPCMYTESAMNYLKWYRQYPEGKPEELITIFTDGNKTEGRFTAELQKKDKKSFLYVPNTSVTDSASYVCATDALCETSYGSQCKNTVLFGACLSVTVLV
uniref:Ig-like domain-containing protein n=1 Tax=Xenopus tropicalis TaxID=8364 RepID=A0A6I8SK67_XENTR